MVGKKRSKSTNELTFEESVEQLENEEEELEQEEEEAEEEEEYVDANRSAIINEISRLSISQQTEMLQLWKSSQQSPVKQSPSSSSVKQSASIRTLAIFPTSYKLPPMLKYKNDDDLRVWVAYARDYIQRHSSAPTAELVSKILTAVKNSYLYLTTQSIVEEVHFTWSQLWTELENQILLEKQILQLEFEKLAVYDYNDVPNFTRQFMSAIPLYENANLRYKHKLFVDKITSPTLRRYVLDRLDVDPTLSILELLLYTNRKAATLLEYTNQKSQP